MMGVEEALILILGIGILAFTALTIETKKLYRMLVYFMGANLCLLGVLGIYGLWIIGGFIVLMNMGVVAIFIFLTLIVGERVEEE